MLVGGCYIGPKMAVCCSCARLLCISSTSILNPEISRIPVSRRSRDNRDQSSTVRTQQELSRPDNGLTPETVDKPVKQAGAPSANAASRQPPNLFNPKFHMHIIDMSMRVCEIFPAGKSEAKGALWEDQDRYLLSLPCSQFFRMRALICFGFVFSAWF